MKKDCNSKKKRKEEGRGEEESCCKLNEEINEIPSIKKIDWRKNVYPFCWRVHKKLIQ